MDYQTIVNYIVAIAPSVASIITTVCAIVVAIKKCKDVSGEALAGTKELKERLASEISDKEDLLEENVALKKSVVKVQEEQNEIIKSVVKQNEELKAQNEKIDELIVQNKILSDQLTELLRKM